MKLLKTFLKHSFILLFMNIDVKFEHSFKKHSPIEVTFKKGDKSIDVKFEQLLKKQ